MIYTPIIGKTVPLEVLTINQQCKRCKKHTNIITGLRFLASHVLRNDQDLHASVYTPGIQPYLLEWLPVGLLKAHIIGKLKVRKSFMAVEKEASYFSNGCHHCDGIQPLYYEDKSMEIEEPLIKLNILFTKDLANIFYQGHINYWWFDTSKATS